MKEIGSEIVIIAVKTMAIFYFFKYVADFRIKMLNYVCSISNRRVGTSTFHPK